MSDIGDTFKAYREIQKKERQDRAEHAMKTLSEEGVPYEIFSRTNYHMRVGGLIDYWPTTGRWKVNNSRVKGFGLRNMLKLYYDKLQPLS